MVEKRVVILLVGIILISAFFAGIIYQFALGNSFFTGRVSFGTVGITLLSPVMNIMVYSPQNATYNFSNMSSSLIDLNVSSDFQASGWWYTLEDLKHGITVNNSILFTPNITISPVRHSNRITVYANNSGNYTNSSSVTFYVILPNTAPILENISSLSYACEGDSFIYRFNASDDDEDILSSDITPKNPFFITQPSALSETLRTATVYSGQLIKSKVGNYSVAISVYDQAHSDSRDMNISIIEINNAPNVQNIGVQTAWPSGENSTFYKVAQVSDIESGNQDSGNFSFNLTFLSGNKFFDISNLGVMNATANSSLIGVYNISLCVTDRKISNIHPNISLCGQDGSNITSCQNFSLTITDENRPPTIITYYPLSFSGNVLGATSIQFNISEYDPDGTLPDTYWYVDGVLEEYDAGSSSDYFTYSFGCGFSGNKTIRAEITDGLANDSLEWEMSVSEVDCPVSFALSAGGGGGGGIPGCVPEWACDDWNVCQSVERNLEIGIISGKDYRNVMNECSKFQIDNSSCGTQIRNCFDINSCNFTLNMPDEFASCQFVTNPSCSDNLKNCHGGACELFIDCGGPCNQCPTCSDKRQNQGENGIDCGGPCPWKCPEEIPLQKNIYPLLWIVFTSLVILSIYKIIRIIKLGKKLKR